MTTISFAEQSRVPDSPGLYEVHTKSGVPLKVGISKRLRRRLQSHAASRQSGLRLRSGGNWNSPKCVISKSSVLAKHLFFDRAIVPGADLRTQEARRVFLLKECVVRFIALPTRKRAREMEIVLEKSGKFRYVGDVARR